MFRINGTHRGSSPRLPFILAAAGILLAQAVGAGELRVATFSCDVTPPIGHPLCGGWIKPLEAVDDPLLAKGVVLEDGSNRYVLCSVDWCLLQTGAFEAFRDQLAAGADVSPDHVSVHTVHQHNAPIADANAELLLRRTEAPPAHLDLDFLAEATRRLAGTVREACRRFEGFDQVGFGQARVEKFASNRRLRREDGSVWVRYSSTKDPAQHAAPEGLIDPWLRTITLLHGDRPLVRMHYYASHPMSYYGDGRATSDTVGLARARLEREEQVPQIYFTGCGGNITAGKYNDGSPEARVALTARIYGAMTRSVAATKTFPVSRVGWRTANPRFFLRTEPEWSEETARRVIGDTDASPQQRLNAALNLAWIERFHRDPTIELHSLELGPVTSLYLPGESFIEYQLFAHGLAPDRPLAVAAYGESGPGYICTDVAFGEGGYEPTDSRVGPPGELEMKRAIGELLRGGDELKQVGHRRGVEVDQQALGHDRLALTPH
ncbi:MAG: hypothetical protein H7A46_22575 [Verrucomicrobiales bacterium]|nr:hypothetical protein [Verrucomicrobiales bacterium]